MVSADYTISPKEIDRLLAGRPVVYVARSVVTQEIIKDAAFDALAYARRKLCRDVAGAISAVLGVCPRVTVEIKEVQDQVAIPNLDDSDARRDVALSLRCTITPARKE